jgi:hypothetical protein
MDTAHFAQRHQQNVVVSETDNLRERAAVMPRGFDATDFTDSAERTFGFDDESNELNHTATILQRPRLASALERLREAMAGS